MVSSQLITPLYRAQCDQGGALGAGNSGQIASIHPLMKHGSPSREGNGIDRSPMSQQNLARMTVACTPQTNGSVKTGAGNGLRVPFGRGTPGQGDDSAGMLGQALTVTARCVGGNCVQNPKRN